MTKIDTNDADPWSEADIEDLRAVLPNGTTSIEEAAEHLVPLRQRARRAEQGA